MSFRFNPITGELDLYNKSGGGGGAGLWERSTDQVGVGITKSIDSIDNSFFKSVKYYLVASAVGFDRIKSYELTVINYGGSYRHSIFNKIKSPDGMSFSLNVIANGSNMELEIQNNEAFAIDFTLTKLISN